MAIIEVNLPSGYIFDPETLNALRNVTHCKRQELKHQNKKLDIYFDFIPKDPETCIYVEAIRSFKVGKTSSAIVRVYDYYETSRKAMESYTVPEFNFCEICKDTQDCDQQNCVD
ncbi:unnamed protein product [Allacma fusca]|uniref:Alpha-macroglobulin receptor-binding domain-containing protein n=1 Tax=Allacma fusca TaxID=39272 RepID=A0A8J2PMB5_9HEXA|nr:unnamed protein product [Allacma fusca]